MEQNLDQQPMKVSDWFVTILITIIPIVGFIMLFVWAFGSNTNQNKANWAKATLLWFAISIVLYAILGITLGAAFLTNM